MLLGAPPTNLLAWTDAFRPNGLNCRLSFKTRLQIFVFVKVKEKKDLKDLDRQGLLTSLLTFSLLLGDQSRVALDAILAALVVNFKLNSACLTGNIGGSVVWLRLLEVIGGS